ncbi:MAG: TIGR03790 family protein [Proteobacteria bacterium]|nr:TIGR03790 family protein [Pseudomonadota bacterium]MBU1585813.1 TIGR03790 family protein [Pseudomonadota bacterium]MBU2451992.1 TIGR03790 family protein [Pseudomonadota bacterium]MBU2627222.1 TIGR03790 family protein [Pseudomonadota bacterium]
MSTTTHQKLIYVFLVFLLFFSFCPKAFALKPEEVLVVANLNASKSKGLAGFYMEKRHIPEKNLVLLFITDQETCTRSEYEKKAVPPIRRFLDENRHIRAIVTMFGIPLKISSPQKTAAEKAKLQKLETKKKLLEDELTNGNISDGEVKKKKHDELSALNKKINNYLKRLDKVASFDSELTLVKKDGYELNMWQPNPFYLGFRNQKTAINQSEVLMTSRLDGASETIVKRIINDSIEAEKNGLKGSAYFDARYKDPGTKKVSGYGFYDKSIHLAAQSLSKENRVRVILNDDSTMFQKGESPDTALYCGWYSLAKYIDAFTWQKGSVGYHIASSECATLKNEKSQVWCKKMLDNGIAATIGPVGEPYVQSFPVPEIFFKYLTEGYLSLAEAYLISLPYLSWKMVLVGDPLYRLNLKP